MKIRPIDEQDAMQTELRKQKWVEKNVKLWYKIVMMMTHTLHDTSSISISKMWS